MGGTPAGQCDRLREQEIGFRERVAIGVAVDEQVVDPVASRTGGQQLGVEGRHVWAANGSCHTAPSTTASYRLQSRG
ncbi:hypothetical protein ABZ864_30860 [Streptomyces sp. NPDC047082]|uniref:hypothetical protein n=1 Tax=Streptomyces sp. NPDC047082 TaxID=3155259 RepID=UPI0033E2A730